MSNRDECSYSNAASKVIRPIKPTPKNGIATPPSFCIRKFIFAKDISIVIPVKNNQQGIDRLLSSLARETISENYPREVIIVDNNSDVPIQIIENYTFEVRILRCTKLGPAAARNLGVANAAGHWILFTDSDCIFTPTLISGYLSDTNECVAYAGNINIIGNDYLASYYRDQNALHPSLVANSDNSCQETWCLITANCLVLKEAFNAVVGFDEGFIYAGGEDTDLGIRLSHIGVIKFNFKSVAIHHFGDGFIGFLKRYIRYGKGNRRLNDLYDHNFWPEHFPPNRNSVRNKVLAWISVEAMRWGYRNL